MASVCDSCQRKSCPGGPGVVGCTEWRNETQFIAKGILLYHKIPLKAKITSAKPSPKNHLTIKQMFGILISETKQA